jgi:hypothetical protein
MDPRLGKRDGSGCRKVCVSQHNCCAHLCSRRLLTIPDLQVRTSATHTQDQTPTHPHPHPHTRDIAAGKRACKRRQEDACVRSVKLTDACLLCEMREDVHKGKDASCARQKHFPPLTAQIISSSLSFSPLSVYFYLAACYAISASTRRMVSIRQMSVMPDTRGK